MRIAFVSTMDGVPWGGSEELWSRTARHMAEEGHDVFASVQHWPEKHSVLGDLESAGVRIDYRRRFHSSLLARVIHKLKQGSVDQVLLGTSSRWIQQQNPDLVCVSLANCRTGLLWFKMLAREQIPYCIVVHGVYETLWPDDRLAAEMRDVYRGARQCFFVSRRNRELFEDMIGGELSNASIVRNPFNVAYNANPEWPSREPNWRIAMVGRLEPHTKAQDILIKVLGQEKWKQRNVRVACYGDGNQFGDCVKRLAARYAPEQVEFMGHQNDIAQIWSENHALAMPSRCEGMPLALVEAMLCGRPAIVTDIAGHTELVEHGINGFVAKAPTVELFDVAMEEAWQRRDQWKALGDNARDKARDIFPQYPDREFARFLLGSTEFKGCH